ncbi:MAG TPA: sensor histidine kinase [Candidatus Dormibacteraeota bacterium]
MVAFLAFYILPIWVILAQPSIIRDRGPALGLLLGSAAVWIWFWLRVCGGPDEGWREVAVALGAFLVGVFTLMTPPAYGTLWIYVVIMVGAAYPWRVAALLVAAASLTGGALDVVRGSGGLIASSEVINAAIVGAVAIAGRLLLETNRELSQAREQIARLAVGEERLRFARDLHDLLGHSLSVIALKSELAGRLLTRSPELAEREVGDIEKVARDALREVRDAVAGYRQPTLAAELAGAREALTAAGIDCRIEGEADGLPPAIEAVLAWAVREGATNVARHSQAKRCSIRMSQKAGQASVEVTDDGRGGTPQPGSGLHGLDERVRERGGTLQAEPLPHEGFRLRVSVPLLGPLSEADSA